MLITIQQLVQRFNLQISGILHIGAHECEELADYNRVGVNNSDIYWVEAMQDKVDLCKTRYNDAHIYQAVIDEEDNNAVVFNITNNGQSSSILEFGTHQVNHPQVHVVAKENLRTIRADTLIEREKIPIDRLNFVNLDIQGVELRALKSMEKYLHHIKYIYTEVNTEQVYKDCNLIGEIDEYLKLHGFTRVTQYIYSDLGWGDAFYMKL